MVQRGAIAIFRHKVYWRMLLIYLDELTDSEEKPHERPQEPREWCSE